MEYLPSEAMEAGERSAREAEGVGGEEALGVGPAPPADAATVATTGGDAPQRTSLHERRPSDAAFGDFEERSPDGRYIRFDEMLGRGAYKTVYKAFDTDQAIEVAWNKLNVSRMSDRDAEKVVNEMQILRALQHPNIINLFCGWEERDERGRIRGANFITELMTSGTLKQYMTKVKTLKLKVIRRWCRNVLEAINYLHSRTPPVMHRDLKCDNIFINGNVGEVKIGDLGLSAVKDKASKGGYTVIGTPEFMAPELYDEDYSEKVDIYAFGMCMLEMVSMEYPYSECDNAGQIFKKVLNGVQPEVLHRIRDGPFKEVILQCLQPEAQRPSAAQLLQLPLFMDWESDDGVADNRDVMLSGRGDGRSHSGTTSPKRSISPSSRYASRSSLEGMTEVPGDTISIVTYHVNTARPNRVSQASSSSSSVYMQAAAPPPSRPPLGAATATSGGSVQEARALLAEAAVAAPVVHVIEAPSTGAGETGVKRPWPASSASTEAICDLELAPAPDGDDTTADVNDIYRDAPQMRPERLKRFERDPADATSSSLLLCLEVPIDDCMKSIKFAFDPERESTQEVAREMVEELRLPTSQLDDICREIERQVHVATTADTPTEASDEARPAPSYSRSGALSDELAAAVTGAVSDTGMRQPMPAQRPPTVVVVMDTQAGEEVTSGPTPTAASAAVHAVSPSAMSMAAAGDLHRSASISEGVECVVTPVERAMSRNEQPRLQEQIRAATSAIPRTARESAVRSSAQLPTPSPSPRATSEPMPGRVSPSSMSAPALLSTVAEAASEGNGVMAADASRQLDPSELVHLIYGQSAGVRAGDSRPPSSSRTSLDAASASAIKLHNVSSSTATSGEGAMQHPPSTEWSAFGESIELASRTSDGELEAGTGARNAAERGAS